MSTGTSLATEDALSAENSDKSTANQSRIMTARQFNFVCKTDGDVYVRTMAVYAFQRIKQILEPYGYEVLRAESASDKVSLRMRKRISVNTDDKNEEAIIAKKFEDEPVLAFLKAKDMKIRRRQQKKGYKQTYKYDLEAKKDMPVVGLCTLSFNETNVVDIVDREALKHVCSKMKTALREQGWQIHDTPVVAQNGSMFSATKLVSERITLGFIENLYKEIIRPDEMRIVDAGIKKVHHCQIEYGLGARRKDVFMLDTPSIAITLAPTVGSSRTLKR
ncbi:MAG: hypothetical protein CMH32_04615 [Micavibrio sp.]|nr:hypothetical protein [Micavibrio sp.]HCK33401.1 hypothetical protein [Rhodospirillaceae bacterium]|tara:strand:+ start:745 stop:1572 length:828 start_codon:yes stop_codon:yes gene_type:complete